MLFYLSDARFLAWLALGSFSLGRGASLRQSPRAIILGGCLKGTQVTPNKALVFSANALAC